MKKFLLWVGVALMAIIATTWAAQAQTWYPANQKTVAWDAVTTLSDGTALPAGSTIQYRVYTAASTDTTKASATEKGVVTSGTSYVLTLSQEGKFFVGVKAERVVSGAVVAVSDISWSDSAAAVPSGATWGIEFYLSPAKALNLRTQ